jgi:tetratricopeptide (TPR) repeat protein
VIAVVWAVRAAAYGGPTAGFELARLDYGVPDARLAWLRAEIVGAALARMVWPFGMPLLQAFEPDPAFASRAVLVPLAALGLALAGLVVCARARARTPLGALAWPFAALLPVVLRQRTLGEFPLADRWACAAVLGWALLVAWAALRHLPRAVAWFALGVLALAYGVETRARAGAFGDDAALLRRAQDAGAETPSLGWRLGRTLLARSDETGDPATLRAAFERFQHTLDLLEAAQRGDRSIYATREDHVQANLGLAWCLLAEARIDPYRDFTTVRGLFDSIARRYPGTVDAYFGRSAAEAEVGDLDAAAASLEEALALAPDSAEAHHRLGRVRMLQGRWDAAAAAFDAALALRPDDVKDLAWRARAAAEAGRTDEALALARRAHELHPGSAAPLVIEGNLRAARGELEPALVLAQQATDLDPDDGEALLLRGKLHAALGQREQAVTVLQRACDRLPQSFEAHYNAAALLLERGSVHEALPYLARAYRLRTSDPAGAQLRETLLALDLPSPEILLALAQEDRRRGQTADALVWSERALELRPDLVDARVLRATILGEQGELVPAAESLTAVTREHPEHLEAFIALGQVEARRGRDAEARLAFERALELVRRAALQPLERASLEERLRDELEQLGGD